MITIPKIFKIKCIRFAKKKRCSKAVAKAYSEDSCTFAAELSAEDTFKRDEAKEDAQEVAPEEPFLLTVHELQASGKSIPGSVNADIPSHSIQARIATIQEWFRAVNEHDVDQAMQFVTDNVQIQFTEGKTLSHEYHREDWNNLLEHLNAAFPDFAFRYSGIKEVQGVIVLQGFRASGTHTGAAFGFGPYDPIPAKGTFLENDPEEAYFYFRPGNDTQFCRATWYTTGAMTGPDGFYTQLGGFPFVVRD